MATFILVCFVVFVLAFVAKLIYDVQQNKKQDKEIDELCKTEAEFELKDKFQTLAGIKGEQTHSVSVDELKKKFENTEFPAPDPSIPVTTSKLTTIGGSYGDSDPLASVPMSRVSKKAKQKMAEIAKEDINKQLEQNAEKFASIFPEAVEYTDEYFKPDYSKSKSKKKSAKPKAKTTVTIDFTNAKGMNEIAGIINPIAEGRVKISVETPKVKKKSAKPKTTKAAPKKKATKKIKTNE